ncbi:Circumsporozoite protein [Phytophthora ramorum]|uniref:SCP domain-containing protein n=1 Tax=Phytophthora ramorum TaxID=164328 RepID=H3H4J7_PHYRM|nr:Circumsporozoite protein [Phytophthora ramorum]
MVNIRSVFTFASVALVAAVSASDDDAMGRNLQAVNFRQELMDSINAARKKEGLEAMCINEMLMDAAQTQANDMADGNFIKSTGSDGTQPKDRAEVEGFKAAVVTEVVGAGYRTASSIVAAWVKSASAKSTLLSKHTVMGPGYTFDKTKKYVHFWAVDFADGECGNGTATASTPAADSTSGSGSVELPASSSGSGSAPAPAPASGSGSETPASGSGSAPAPAPASGSGSDTPASGSGSATPAPAAATPAPAAASGSGAETPASGSGSEAPAATPAPAAASGSGAETPAAASGSAEAPATDTPAQ